MSFPTDDTQLPSQQTNPDVASTEEEIQMQAEEALPSNEQETEPAMAEPIAQADAIPAAETMVEEKVTESLTPDPAGSDAVVEANEAAEASADLVAESASEVEGQDVGQPILLAEASAVEATSPEMEALPETSLNEEVDEQAEAEAAKEEEFHALSRKEMVKRLQEIGQQAKINDALLRKLKAAYEDQFAQERNTALAAFKEEGGLEEDFEFRKDQDAIEFESLLRMVRERRKKQLEEIDQQKRINLKLKQQLIEDLKQLNDKEESNGSIEEIKRIMDKWRAVGPVPHTDSQELFKNFEFQVDKFYSRRTEFFEMKELDRKRNLERKTALLERAKKTLDEARFVDGLREYNRIYEEFRHTGPAPKEENDRLYKEIKEVGTQLHDRKKAYDEAQRIEAEKVAAIRQGLVVQMDLVSNFTSETIAEWQAQTDLVQKLIADWKGASSRYRDQEPEVSKRFWSGLKKFYAAKDIFFKKLDKERAENLTKKREILAKVQELAQAENKQKAQSEINALVAAWKEVGPVAYKDRDKLNKEFSKALDTYYEAKRNTVSAEQTEQRENLAQKQALVDQLKALAEAKKGSEDELKAIQQAFNAVGFVPFKKKDEISAAFKEAFQRAIDQTSEIGQGQKAYVKLEMLRTGGRGGRPMGGPIQREAMGQRGTLNKRIAGLENDVRNYRTNMDFISRTKNGEKLKAEFNERIAKAEEEINLLRTQLKELENQQSDK